MEYYKSTIIYNDKQDPETEEFDFSSFNFNTEDIYLSDSNNYPIIGKHLECINLIYIRSIFDKNSFPIKNKGKFRCKIVFKNKEEYEFEFMDYKTNTSTNTMLTLNDDNVLIIYTDYMNCILIPFKNVYQFAYKDDNCDDNFRVIRNRDISINHDHRYNKIVNNNRYYIIQ